MTEDGSPTSGGVDDETVRRMVRSLEPGWRVEAIDRSDHGTDFVATLDVDTADGERSAVLKAMTADHVSAEAFAAEPRLLALVDRETSVPVPSVVGYRDEHDELPAPFYLMDRVDGENFEGDPHALSPTARERVCREAGRNLAELHEIGPLPLVGPVGVTDGELAVYEGDAYGRDAFHDWLLDTYEDTLDSLADGGYFPRLADDRERFAHLVPDLREFLRETIPALPAPDPPTYCHKDYRYGNLLVDPATGRTRAVLDWGTVMSAPPAFNVASAESLLLTPDEDDPERTTELRRSLRSAYADARTAWSFDDATRERLRVYRLACRLDAMACLPLWYREGTPADRDERAAEHRSFVESYL